MPKIPGVTSEILKKKVLDALEGIGIKAYDIMGKGTNVRRLTKGPDINPFKPNMLEAMRAENKTMGDALDAFANEAKFIMGANDAETLNFLNNLNTYTKIGGGAVDTQGVGSMFKAMTDLEESAKNLKKSTDEAKTEAEKQMKDALEAAAHGGPFKVPNNKYLGGSMHEEGQLRTGIRQFLETELNAGRLKLNEKDTHRVRNYYPTTEDDVILVFKRIYGDDAHKKAGTFPGAFEKGESFSHYEKIFRENMGDEFLKVKNTENVGDGTLVLDESLEYKKPLPDDDDIPFNQGGRVGMWKGSGKKGVGSLIKLVDDKFGEGTLKKAADIDRPEAAIADEETRKLFQDFNMKLTTEDLMKAAEPKMAGPLLTKNKGFWDPESTDHTTWLLQEKFFRPDAKDFLGQKVPSNWIALEREQAKKTLKELGPLPSKRHPNWEDMRRIRQGVKNRLVALDITEELGGNVAMFDYLRMTRGSPEKFLNVEDYIKKADSPIVKDELSGIKKAFITKQAQKEGDPGWIKQGEAITEENFGTSQFAPSDESIAARKKGTGQVWKDEKGETKMIALGGFSESEKAALDKAFIKGNALSNAMKAIGMDPTSAKQTLKFDELVEQGMIGFPADIREQIIRAKYGDIVDPRLLEQMVTDTDPQHLAVVMGTVDEAMKMHETGMNPQEIIEALKANMRRRPQALGGGVGSMFRGV